MEKKLFCIDIHISALYYFCLHCYLLKVYEAHFDNIKSRMYLFTICKYLKKLKSDLWKCLFILLYSVLNSQIWVLVPLVMVLVPSGCESLSIAASAKLQTSLVPSSVADSSSKQ